MRSFLKQLGWGRFDAAIDAGPKPCDVFLVATVLAILITVWPLSIMLIILDECKP